MYVSLLGLILNLFLLELSFISNHNNILSITNLYEASRFFIIICFVVTLGRSLCQLFLFEVSLETLFFATLSGWLILFTQNSIPASSKLLNLISPIFYSQWLYGHVSLVLIAYNYLVLSALCFLVIYNFTTGKVFQSQPFYQKDIEQIPTRFY